MPHKKTQKVAVGGNGKKRVKKPASTTKKKVAVGGNGKKRIKKTS